ncbi:MAG: CheR family methyltransferase [Gemmatimonas sp.]
MTPADFQFLAKFLKDQSGLALAEDKGYLLESRLVPVARAHGLKSVDEIAAEVRAGRNQRLMNAVVEAMTTNESFFFRDIKPFDQFKTFVLPQMLARRASTKQLRIWSAACSTGQEPYTLAMLLTEAAAQLQGWRVEIIATDIAPGVLAKARAGLYSQFEVQRGLPVQMLLKHFSQKAEGWEIAPQLRAMINFREFNLLSDMKALGTFDVVFCRNVLIYFDQLTKSDVLARIRAQMREDGILYLGGAETVLGVSESFRPVQGQRGLYATMDPAASIWDRAAEAVQAAVPTTGAGTAMAAAPLAAGARPAARA